MFKRFLFFWFDKLKITRSERMAVAILLFLLVSLTLADTLVHSHSPFDNAYYKALDKQFQKRTALMKQKRLKILTRYKAKPTQQLIAVSSLKDDTTKKKEAAGKKSSSGKLININTAGFEKLQELPGVGPSYAREIIQYRKENGPFKTSRELLNIKGIGPARLHKIAPEITFGQGAGQTKILAKDSTARINHHKRAVHTLPGGTNIININTADARMLETIPGIGPAFAKRIMQYRQKNGGFKSKNELLNIKGIGPARLHKIAPEITFGDGTAKSMASSIDSSAHNKDQKSSTLHGAPEQQNIININTADAKLLETLPGIGPAFAKKIMQYRQKHDGFKNKSELLNIKGIGKKRLAKIKPFIKLGE